MSRNIYDIDPAGNVLCTYNGESQESLKAVCTYLIHLSPSILSSINLSISPIHPSIHPPLSCSTLLNQHQTKVPPLHALLNAFLPAGYPHSVTPDYLPYQTYDSLQAFFSSISSLLANRAVLEGLGVGDASSSPTAALILKITSDTISRFATILFAHRLGTAIEPECKFFRFLADVLNDAAQLLDLVIPVAVVETRYSLKLGVIVGSGVLRSWCGVAAGASKASLSAHFVTQKSSLAELNAKEASQETVVSLLGMLVGSLVVKVVQDRLVVWVLMVGLLGVHLLMNYRGVRCVRLRTLNRQRATMVVREWLETGRVLGPEEVSKRESILQLRIGWGWGRGGGWTGFGRMASKSGEYTGTCEFGTYGDVKALAGWKGGYHSYEFETEGYFMGICHRGGNFRMRIALKEEGDEEEEEGKKMGSSARGNSPLEAWFDAVNHAYHFDSALKDGLESHYENEVPLLGYTSEEQKGTVFAALAAAGWDLETNALETRSPVRVRVGDGKKVPIPSEKDLIRQPQVSKKD
ncbi:vitamin B6 photo-protection and homoeostasis-domain-containing protein [Neurospora crassa]|nr:vitamin B6 photo-protection and homoeostasis-domain-containing protein [Neurospora crassa]